MISYQTDGIEMPAIKKRETTEWIKAVAATYNKRIGEIAYIFCSDEKILEVNRQYLQHDYYTDIITFDYCEGNRLSGDLFISLDTVRTNAEQFAGNDYERELYRVIIHGILHLCGINDKGPGEREIMEAAENKAPRHAIKSKGVSASKVQLSPLLLFLHNLSSLVTNHLASLYQRGIAEVTTNMIRVMTNNRSSPSKTGYTLLVNALTQ